ncbi:MAG: isoprenylcysteine carboxylmethyltransferase family protein [Anaerolineae bacterium]|jgi:protein-S-isoprenylcysteine O-methyltransferase Ste14
MPFRRVIGTVALTVALAATLFLSSGRADWTMAWIYVGLRAATAAVGMLVMASRHPGLLEERFAPGEGVKAWDRPLASITTILWPAILILAGLDRRFGWSPELRIVIRLGAMVVLLLGDVLSKWAAVSNRFYSRLVRVQKDRGHTVVTDGPYQHVRHPGYAGALVTGLATPIALGSMWALLAAGVLALLLVVRTALEDETLHVELPGYPEYAERTRHRLVPRVW